MNLSSTTAVADSSDVVLVGSGIMSASLGALLKGLDPRLSIRGFEVTPELAREASDGWNNAGTGHAGLCELSYTPAREPDGSVKIGRAQSIFEQFEHSKQFWAHAVESGMAGPTADFIYALPHICFVQGAADVVGVTGDVGQLRKTAGRRQVDIGTLVDQQPGDFEVAFPCGEDQWGGTIVIRFEIRTHSGGEQGFHDFQIARHRGG